MMRRMRELMLKIVVLKQKRLVSEQRPTEFPQKAQEYLDKLCAIKWKNYLTKKEALSIIQKMDPKATWDMQVWYREMKKHNLHTEDRPCYNDYALYLAMNQVVSDHGETVAKILGKDNLSDIDDDHLLVYAYSLAVDLLKDKDGVYDIREYFMK